MSLTASFLRLPATGMGLVLLALSLVPTPAHPQDGSMVPPQPPGQQPKSIPPPRLAPASAEPPQMPGPGGPSAWVKLCEKNQLKLRDKDGNDTVKDIGACVTMTEQLHLDTGQPVLGVELQQVRLEGHERYALSVTVPLGMALGAGAEVTVLPADLWLKVQRAAKLDSSDEARLNARTMTLPFSYCIETGCIAEIELTPPLFAFLKDNAGLVVRTLRRIGTPLIQPVTLAGFALALEGAPTDTKRYLQTRAELMQAIVERQRHIGGGMKKRADEPERTPARQ